MIKVLFIALVGILAQREGDTTTFNKKCPPEGLAKAEKEKELYRKKGYWVTPRKYKPMKLSAFLRKGADRSRWKEGDAVEIHAYVDTIFNYKSPEKCNCDSEEEVGQDVRIYMVTKPRKYPYMVAEISPRFREIISNQGYDFSTPGLKAAFQKKKVIIRGYLMYDYFHQKDATNYGYASYPKKPRATAWEIHPVTDILLDE